MEPQIAETLLGSPGDMARLHRRVVRVGAAAGWFCAVLFIVVGLFTGDSSYYLEAVGPILAGGLMTSQIVLRKENAGVALLGSATVVVVAFLLIGDETTLLAASLAVVIIASIGMLFIQVRHLLLTLALGAALFLVPLAWGVPPTQAISLGSVMAVSFGLTSAIFYAVRNAATRLNRRFQVLFEHSPTAVLELDWTDALNFTRSEFSGRPDRIRGFLGAYPNVTRKAASLVRVVRANQAALDLLRVDNADQVLGTMGEERIPQEWVDCYTEVLVHLFQGESFLDFEFKAVTFDLKSKWLNARCVNVATAGEADGVLVALADTTHLKAREDAMHDLIRTKDEFVASISHELRTPLTAVVGLTSEMISGGFVGDERDELIELVASQAQEMSYIIDDLLVAARSEIGTVAVALAEVDLGAELSAAIEGVGVQFEDLPSGLPVAIGDGPRVRQILRNLLTNQERYGGSVRRVVAGATRGRVWIEIRDNGSGVPEADAARIFEPYASAHRGVSSSVGLGLSVARSLAELMGGSLTYARDGDESVFRLELASAEKSLFV